jgi:hypothetical protein
VRFDCLVSVQSVAKIIMNNVLLRYQISLKYCGTQALACASFCTFSRKQSEFGYYQAHHSKLPNDGIASSEYVMNGPKPLGTKVVTQRMPTTITKYSWEDASSEVRTYYQCILWVILRLVLILVCIQSCRLLASACALADCCASMLHAATDNVHTVYVYAYCCRCG